jgi:hypothetical protein
LDTLARDGVSAPSTAVFGVESLLSPAPPLIASNHQLFHDAPLAPTSTFILDVEAVCFTPLLGDRLDPSSSGDFSSSGSPSDRDYVFGLSSSPQIDNTQFTYSQDLDSTSVSPIVPPLLGELSDSPCEFTSSGSSSDCEYKFELSSSSRIDGTQFYAHSQDLDSTPVSPLATFFSLDPPAVSSTYSRFLTPTFFANVCTPSCSSEWDRVMDYISVLRPAYACPISEIFPEFSACQSFDAVLTVAATLAAKDLDLPAAQIASHSVLSHESTKFDTNLVNAHETSVLQQGLFVTLARAQSLLFSEALSPLVQLDITPSNPFFERITALAFGNNPVLFPPAFRPNFGRRISPLPPSIAPEQVILAHIAKEQRAHRIMVLSESIFLRACIQDDSDSNLSNVFVIGKSPDHPLGRMLLNTPTINDVCKKPLLANRWGPLCPAQLVDLCEKLLNAKSFFPEVPIYGARRDVDSAYMRILMHIGSIPLCALLIMINGVRFVALLLCNHFGVADSNYHFGVLSAFFLFNSRNRLSHVCPVPLSEFLTDDFCMFGPLSIVTLELDAVGADFQRYLGHSAVSVPKDVCATSLEMGGAFFNCKNMTIRMTQKGFAKLLHCFFTTAPDSPQVGDKFPIKSFQQLGSLAIYYSNFLSAGLAYSRGFHNAIASFNESDSYAFWTLRAIGDLFMWRILLLLSLDNCAWLTVPVYRPVLLRRTRLQESDLEKGFRHAAAATSVAYSDGCITNHGFAPNGLGGYQAHPHGFWFSANIADMPFYASHSHCLLPTDINLVEFVALVITLRCMIFTRIASHGHCHNCHFHIWSDNTSCLSWIRRHRALQPLHYILLQLFALLQMRYGVLVTVAHIPGWANIYADAPSRQFHVDNLDHIRSVLSLVPELTISSSFTTDIVKLGTAMLDAPSQQVLGGLTLLESAIGAISVA